jgi:hypothetical protein
MTFSESQISNRQEGEEWISRLEEEALVLTGDLLIAQETLSDLGVASIAFGLNKTYEAIEEIKLEMMMLDG